MSDPRPPLRPGYNRDPLVEGDMSQPVRLDPEYIDGEMFTQWNWPLILVILGLVMFGIPLSVMLWVLAIGVL